MMLQINTSGAWRNVCEFSPGKYVAVVDCAQRLADILGTHAGKPCAKFCVLHPDGKRDWLRFDSASSSADQWSLGTKSKGL